MDTVELNLPYMRQEIETKLVNSKAVIYHQNIIILASYENEKYFFKKELQSLKTFIESNNYKQDSAVLS